MILTAFGLRRRNAALLERYRCSPFVVEAAASLLTPEEAEQFRIGSRTGGERETLLLYTAEDFEHEREQLIEMIKMRQIKGERVAILLPQKRQVHGFAKGLRESGLEVECQKQRGNDDGDGALDFNSELPKLLTYHSAKGLTFDSVLLPRLAPNSFVHLTEERTKRLLFVAMTRASNWLYFSATHGRELSALCTSPGPTLCQIENKLGWTDHRTHSRGNKYLVGNPRLALTCIHSTPASDDAPTTFQETGPASEEAP